MVTKKPTKKAKSFDCVEMMHQAAQAVQSVTAKMTFQEKVAYWREQSREFRREMAGRRKTRKESARQVP